MKNTISIKEYLKSIDTEYSQTFDKLKKLTDGILPDHQSCRYKKASGIQSVEAFNNMNSRIKPGLIAGKHIENYNDELTTGLRLYFFGMGKASGLLGVFIWTKRAVIKDLLTSLDFALSGINIITAIILLRPIIEQVAAVSVFARDINLFFTKDRLCVEDKSNNILEICEIVSKKGNGTRIDWEAYISKSLRIGKKKSYKPEEGTVDITASDLMNSIDFLDKTVKGTRKAYELASEFAHPNVGSHFIYGKSASKKTLEDGIVLWDKVSSRNLPEKGIEQLHERIVEMISIALESIDYLMSTIDMLEKRQKIIDKWAKDTIRHGVQKNPHVFHLKEPCPCFSGHKFGHCCGKKVKHLQTPSF